jgi:hypothetical protein
MRSTALPLEAREGILDRRLAVAHGDLDDDGSGRSAL